MAYRHPLAPTLAVGAVLALALALTWAAAEHAPAGLQVPVAMASSVLHLLAMAVWLGGLTALLTTLQRAAPTTVDDTRATDPAATAARPEGPEGLMGPEEPERTEGVAGPEEPERTEGVAGAEATAGQEAAARLPEAAVVARFSRLAFLAVTVLVVTGLYQSWRGLGSWSALTGTTYGRLLLVKLAAVALLLAVAGRSRHWTARLGTAPAGPRALRRAVLAEVGVASWCWWCPRC